MPFTRTLIQPRTLETEALPPIEIQYTPFNLLDCSIGEIKTNRGTLPNFDKGSEYRFVDLYGEGIPGILFADGRAVWYFSPLGNGRYEQAAMLDEFPIDRDIYVNEHGNPNKLSADLQGDGLGHLMMNDADHIKYYPSLKKEGYANPLKVKKPIEFPVGSKDAYSRKVFFTDIFGDELSHCVHVSNGSVECFPNLGYGHFGSKIVLKGFQYLEEDFDANRVFFKDINGTGPSDLVYVHPERLDIYINKGDGNFEKPVSVNLPEIIVDYNQIDFSDIMGNGTNCLIMAIHKGAAGKHRYIDFCRGKKPFLLKSVVNNLGKETDFDYVSSIRYYLEDKEKGINWDNTVPFPVHIVEKIQTRDMITGKKENISYYYKNAFYDADERHFVGFSQVDETKQYFHFTEKGTLEENSPQAVCTKRYYYSNNSTNAIYKDVLFDLKQEDCRLQAKKALWGKIYKKEIYLLEQHKNEDVISKLYDIRTYNYLVKQCSALPDAARQSLFVQKIEKLYKTYDAFDMSQPPSVRHDLILDFDDLGNVKRKCSVFYGINGVDTTIELTDYQYVYIENKGRIVFAPKEETKYDLSKPAFLQANDYFTYDLCKSYAEDALSTIVDFGELLNDASHKARLCSIERYFYWDQELDRACPFGLSASPFLLHHTERAAFPENYYKTKLGLEVEEGIVAEESGYVLKGGYWWNKSLVTYYLGGEGYYLPIKQENDFVNPLLYKKAEMQYDKYMLFPILFKEWVSDSAGELFVKAKVDYLCLKYTKIADANENVWEALYSPLGLILAYTTYGTLDGKPIGKKPLKDYKSQNAELTTVINSPDLFLQDCITVYHYSLDNYWKRNKPVSLAEITTVSLGKTASEPCCKIMYFDGGHNAVEIKEKSGQTWAVTKYEISHKQELPLLRLTPFFSQSHEFDCLSQTDRLPELFIYDGINRLICKKMPFAIGEIKGYLYWSCESRHEKLKT